ncbi:MULTISPECIES: 3'-5' exonuclease [Massilia]|uniref:3'-5' exonuclease n=1 Tax=Massilia TaxID=149698 RepID=UPI001C631FFE|nr:MULTISPECIES: 3'-5' exonuclease [Massilia]QYG02079.1 3'-5' exonuclease domain-containing protein 2 [Massilia sp. NP310]
MSAEPGILEDDLPPDLPPYVGIDLARVRLVRSEQDAREALAELLAGDAIGFDTESKPTFAKGEVSTGPHLVQLATLDTAWLFQTATPAGIALAVTVLKPVLEDERVLKVGFGLGDDVKRLKSKFGIGLRNVLDLSTALRRRGEKNPLGARSAVERFFGQRLQKSKRITTTNWALPRLSDKQLQYAADDAHAALKIYRQWKANPPA